jgi:hypothetical protein
MNFHHCSSVVVWRRDIVAEKTMQNINHSRECPIQVVWVYIFSKNKEVLSFFSLLPSWDIAFPEVLYLIMTLDTTQWRNMNKNINKLFNNKILHILVF